MAEERTYIPFTSRAKATTFDGILSEAHQIEDLDYGGAPKNQHDINAEVKANLARIEGIAGSAAAGAYVFKGSLNGLEDLLLLSNVKVGDVYNIKTEFELAGELNPGGAKTKYPAGTNVAATKAMSASVSDGWDALGGVTLDLAPITQEIEKLKTGKYDASKVVTTSATNDDAHVLTAKATHEAIADALDVVAPDVTDLKTSVENIKKFVTVPFDGYASGSISIESMGTENVAQILYDIKSKSFVAKGTDGKYYNSWRVPDTDGRQRDLYINGMASHPKKLYVYNNEIYTISQLGLSLTIGKNLTTVDGEDNVRGVTQAAIAGKLKNYLTKGETAANYVSKTTYQELVDRVEKLEARLKLA